MQYDEILRDYNIHIRSTSIQHYQNGSPLIEIQLESYGEFVNFENLLRDLQKIQDIKNLPIEIQQRINDEIESYKIMEKLTKE